MLTLLLLFRILRNILTILLVSCKGPGCECRIVAWLIMHIYSLFCYDGVGDSSYARGGGASQVDRVVLCLNPSESNWAVSVEHSSQSVL